MCSSLECTLLVHLQELFDKCENKFKGPTTGAPRSVFSKLVNTWASLSHTVLVLAGTGLRLADSLALVASAVFKYEADLRDLLIVDFDMYDQLESMQAYLTQFFPVPSHTMDDIFSILTGIKRAVLANLFSNVSIGRNRTSALFVTQVLTNKDAKTGEDLFSDCVNEVKLQRQNLMQTHQCRSGVSSINYAMARDLMHSLVLALYLLSSTRIILYFD